MTDNVRFFMDLGEARAPVDILHRDVIGRNMGDRFGKNTVVRFKRALKRQRVLFEEALAYAQSIVRVDTGSLQSTGKVGFKENISLSTVDPTVEFWLQYGGPAPGFPRDPVHYAEKVEDFERRIGGSALGPGASWIDVTEKLYVEKIVVGFEKLGTALLDEDWAKSLGDFGSGVVHDEGGQTWDAAVGLADDLPDDWDFSDGLPDYGDF